MQAPKRPLSHHINTSRLRQCTIAATLAATSAGLFCTDVDAWLVGLVAAVLVLANYIRRHWFRGNRRLCLATIAASLFLPAVTLAQSPVVAIDVSAVPDGQYLLTIDQGAASIRPIQLLTISGQTPNKPPTQPTPNSQPTNGTIESITRQATARVAEYPKRTDHRDALAVGYAVVGLQLQNGTLSMSAAAKQVDDFLGNALGSDSARWAEWRETVDAKLDAMQDSGQINNAKTLGDAYASIAQGLRSEAAGEALGAEFIEQLILMLFPQMKPELVKLIAVLVGLLFSGKLGG